MHRDRDVFVEMLTNIQSERSGCIMKELDCSKTWNANKGKQAGRQAGMQVKLHLLLL